MSFSFALVVILVALGFLFAVIILSLSEAHKRIVNLIKETRTLTQRLDALERERGKP